MTPLELRDLDALTFLRCGRVQQVIRVPPTRDRTRPWYLALDGTFADESSDPAVVVLAVGNMATHWKPNATFSPPARPTPATQRDLEAFRRLRVGEVNELVWLRGREVFLAIGPRGRPSTSTRPTRCSRRRRSAARSGEGPVVEAAERADGRVVAAAVNLACVSPRGCR